MTTIAHRLFPRARGKEAMFSLSAVIAGGVGSVATLVLIVGEALKLWH
jgi:hypothetical protein